MKKERIKNRDENKTHVSRSKDEKSFNYDDSFARFNF